MGIATALTDQPQVLQPVEQRRADFGPLADEAQHFGVPQPLSQPIRVLEMVVPDGDVVTIEHGEAGEPANRVEVVIEDRYSHGVILTAQPAPTRIYFGGCIAAFARSAIAGGIEYRL
jgi:hypothetical protein